MRLAPPTKNKPVRTEQIILFRTGGALFAISSASVQEVRSVDSFAGSATEISAPGLRKVRHFVQREGEILYVVNGALHFGLPIQPAALVFVLRKTRTVLLIDGIDKMTSMTYLQSLPLAFCQEERAWYRGLTALEQSVVPVVKPEGFLSLEELALLDSAVLASQTATLSNSAEAGAPQ